MCPGRMSYVAALAGVVKLQGDAHECHYGLLTRICLELGQAGVEDEILDIALTAPRTYVLKCGCFLLLLRSSGPTEAWRQPAIAGAENVWLKVERAQLAR